MPAWIISILTALLPLLLGGTLFAAFIRPRAYYAMREYTSTRAFSPDQRARVEQVLERESIPTTFAEVEWWNIGKRAAHDVEIEVAAPARIMTWGITPDEGDLIAGWRVTQPPMELADGRFQFRIGQARLMPTGRTNLTIGYAGATDDAVVRVKAILPDRVIPLASQVRRNHNRVVNVVWLPGYLVIAFLLDRVPAIHNLPHVPQGTSWEFVALFGGFLVYSFLIFMTSKLVQPGSAAWGRQRWQDHKRLL